MGLVINENAKGAIVEQMVPNRRIGFLPNRSERTPTGIRLNVLNTDLPNIMMPISVNDAPIRPRNMVKSGIEKPALIAADNIIRMNVM